jgi:hypothetical protein
MTSAITEYDYPSRFVDEQQRGPFRRTPVGRWRGARNGAGPFPATPGPNPAG